jgi:hypothetical protein
MSRRHLLLVAIALVALVPAVAHAVPPGGAVENPRGATVAVTPATVASGGTVAFTGAGFEPGEQVSVKLDDGAVRAPGGGDVLATVLGAGDGTLAGTIALAPLGVPDGPHALRFLSTMSAGARSLKVDFTVGALPTPVPTPAATPAATPAPSPAAPAIVTRTATPRHGRLALTLRGGATATTAKLTVRTRDRVRLGGRTIVVALAPARTVRLAAGATRTVRLELTMRVRGVLARHTRLPVRVTLAPRRGATVTAVVQVRRG